MITFLTLFLGLLVGPAPIGVQVDERVREVEFLLDRQSVARIASTPWRVVADFGPDLRPHLIEVVAYDGTGIPIARASQRVNAYRAEVEVGIALDRDKSGRPRAAGIVSSNLEFGKPTALEVRLDGTELRVGDDLRVELPGRARDGALHVLTATAFYPRGLSASAELAFGPHVEEASSLLTAVPVIGDPRHVTAQALARRFTAGGKPVEVVAVERGAADIVIVPDRTLPRAIEKWNRQILRDFPNRGRLAHDHELRFVLPQATRGSGASLFDISPREAGDRKGMPFQLASVAGALEQLGSQSLADAVAVAATRAVDRNRRRALVLALRDGSQERSTHSIEEVRAFLRMLHVPLYVWRFDLAGDIPLAGWGMTDEVPNVDWLVRAARHLDDELERQRVVWLKGTFLPQEIEIVADPSRPLRFAE